MNVTVFLGPTLALEDAQALLPSATYRPPAAQGDLLAAVDQDGAEIIGLIDGTFHHTLSVWHSEICYLLNRGISIFGASSMGALRAAETQRFGTVGVGTVFRWYRDGVITADDEVALIHGDERDGFRQMSLVLVNIRASLDLAVKLGSITRRDADLVVEATKSIYYPDRYLKAILSRCSELMLSAAVIEEIARVLTSGHVDIKAQDARDLLRVIRSIVDGKSELPQRIPFQFERSSVFDTLYSLDRRVKVGEREVSLQSIREHAAINDPDYEKVQRASLDRSVVAIFGMLLGLEPTETDISDARQSFLASQGLTDATKASVTGWLVEHAMSDSDLDEYVFEEALCQRLRAWILNGRGLDRSCRTVLNEARHQGLFLDWASAAASAMETFEAFHHEEPYIQLQTEDPIRLAARHFRESGVRLSGDATLLAERLGFEDVPDLVDELRRSVVVADVQARVERQIVALARAERAKGLLPGSLVDELQLE